MAKVFTALGGTTQLNSKIVDLAESKDDIKVTIDQNGKIKNLATAFLITCSGLMADRMTKMMGIPTDFHIIPSHSDPRIHC